MERQEPVRGDVYEDRAEEEAENWALGDLLCDKDGVEESSETSKSTVYL